MIGAMWAVNHVWGLRVWGGTKRWAVTKRMTLQMCRFDILVCFFFFYFEF